MNKRRTVKLGDEIDLLTGFPFESKSYSTKIDDIKLLRGDNIAQGNFRWDDVKRWPKTEIESYQSYQLQENDVVLAMDRPWIGAGLKFSSVSKRDLPCLLVQRTARMRGRDNLDNRYLKYVVGSPWFSKYIQKITTGSLVPHISSKQIKEFSFDLPPLTEQQKIASVLSAIDAKIELNNRINAELGAMAKTLYDYWFVQFDFPFDFAQGKPAANGKPYKSSGGKMVYDPIVKREIPEGWDATPLSAITKVSNDSLNPADTPEKAFNHFSIPVFDATNTYGVELGETIGSNKFTVEKTDLLVSKLNPWFNRVVYAMDEEGQICSTEFVVWRSANTQIKNFLYLIATSPQFIAHCTQSATGTSNSHKRVNPNVMMRFQQPFNGETAGLFGQIVEPVLKQLIVNQRENTKLGSLRDWLLPMLMNGQVTVK